MSDLVHDPTLFEHAAWAVLARGYRIMAVELEEAARSARPDRPAPGPYQPMVVELVLPGTRRGRTGRRKARVIYSSLRKALKAAGRWVRSSLDSGQPLADGRQAIQLKGVRS